MTTHAKYSGNAFGGWQEGRMRRITPAPTCRSVPHFHGARRRLSFLCIGLVTLSIAVGAVSDLRAGSNVFIESGIAASDREWTGPDYAQAAEILATGKVPLPQETDDVARQSEIISRQHSANRVALRELHPADQWGEFDLQTLSGISKRGKKR